MVLAHHSHDEIVRQAVSSPLLIVAGAVVLFFGRRFAQRLLMSRGTVKAHLAHVFTKLDVSRRAELASVATRHAP